MKYFRLEAFQFSDFHHISSVLSAGSASILFGNYFVCTVSSESFYDVFVIFFNITFHSYHPRWHLYLCLPSSSPCNPLLIMLVTPLASPSPCLITFASSVATSNPFLIILCYHLVSIMFAICMILCYPPLSCLSVCHISDSFFSSSSTCLAL